MSWKNPFLFDLTFFGWAQWMTKVVALPHCGLIFQLNPQWAAFQKSSDSLLQNFWKFSRVQKLFSLLETADVFLSRQEFWREFQNFELFIQKVCNDYKLMAKNVQAWTINKWVYFTLKHCSKSLQLLPSKTCCPCDELEKAELFIPKTLKVKFFWG